MLKIVKLKTENLKSECITDNPAPVFSFSLESDKNNVTLDRAEVTVNGWSKIVKNQLGIKYGGPALKPFSVYSVSVTAFDTAGEKASASMTFETGRLNTGWTGKWITDGSYKFKEKKASPKPMTFKKEITLKKEVRSARLYSTALGIYEFEINGKKAGRDYFAPGFTSYKNQLQYQVYDITALLEKKSELVAVVAGGWAAGKFTHCLRNRIFVPRQSFLCELRIEYADDSEEVIGSDESWLVTRNGKFKECDFYDGEVYDACADLKTADFKPASIEKLKIDPQIIAAYGAPVRAHEQMVPVLLSKENGALIFDFKQNFAGVINAVIKNSEKGKTIVFRHAEILKDGKLFTEPLRTAKATAVYICSGKETETYSPRFTYMGFRYVEVTGIDEKDLTLSAFALYSDLPLNGTFECSNDMLNRLQSNIVWSAKSNFIDIPTDCPQRDERMGWTGDIAVFAPTASYNFDTSRFYEKWLTDLRTDQKKTGGVPVTIPHVVFKSNLESVFTMAIDHWGDSCILVPYAEYLARGDVSILEKSYFSMKRYLKACKFWAGLFSVGKRRRIWKMGHHYGDWCAPGIGLFGWMGRGKWTATAAFANSTRIVADIAEILGQKEDAAYYRKLNWEICRAYSSVLTDKKGKLKKEFQTAYVMPLHYGVFKGEEKAAAAANLKRLIEKNNYNIGTGFSGTPYVLFALADNGYIEDAYKMLLNDTCPSWLHEVKVGGTTIWERWDAIKDSGIGNLGKTDGTHGMVSFNHYANGAVGDFMYKRIGGIEPLKAGYSAFKIQPVIGGGITFVKASVGTPYGTIVSDWKIEDGSFKIDVSVPVCTECTLKMPDGTEHKTGSGNYSFCCDLRKN